MIHPATGWKEICSVPKDREDLVMTQIKLS